MKKQSINKPERSNLQSEDEELQRRKSFKTDPEFIEAGLLKLKHESDVRSIEPELQNEELKLSNNAAQDALQFYGITPAGYIKISNKGKIIDLNLNIGILSEKVYSRLKNAQFISFLTDESKPIFSVFLNDIFNKKIKASCDVTLQAGNNLPIYFFLTGFADDNEAQCIVAVFDISSRKQEETSALETVLRYKTLLQTSNDGIHVLDDKGKVVEANEAFCKMLGYTREELFKLNVADWDMQWKGKELLQKVNEFITSPAVFETKHRCKDGKIYDAEINGIGVELGGHSYLYASARDITKRKIAESELRGVLSLTDAAFESIHNGILIVNSERKVLKTNARFAQMWHIPVAIIESGDDSKVLDYIMGQLAEPEAFMAKVNELYCNPESESLDFVHFNDGRIFERISKPLYNDNIAQGRVWSFLDVTDRKHAEEALRKSEEKYKTLFENTGTSIIIIEEDTTISLSNEQFSRRTGYPRIEVEGRIKWTDIVDDEDIGKMLTQHQMRRKVPGYASPNYEFRYRTKSGELRYALVNVQMLPGSSSSIASIIDITDRKLADDLLAQTRQNYESFFNTIDELLFVLDEQGNIIHSNKSVFDRLGYTEDELYGKSVLMVHPPERREEAGRIVGEILEGKTEYCPVPVITKEGIQIPVETRVSHGFWDGRPVIFGITKDISQVRLSEEKYAKLFYNNHSACGLSEFETGRYFEVNDAFYNLFGFTSEEVIGKSALDLGILTPESSNDLISKVGEKDKIKNIEFNLIAKNGDIKHVLISGENIYIQNKKFRYTIVNDITERKKAEELLRESEVKYKTLFENTGTAIIIIEEDTTISLANEEFASRTGYLRAEVEGVKKWTDIVAQEDIAWMLARHQMRRENPDDTTPVYEFRYRTKSGELKYALINVQLIPGTKKSMASLIDITDRKQAEIALKDSETKLRGILNNSRDAIGVHINGICEICNPAALQLFGVSSPDDLIGKPILNVVAPRERKRIQDFVTKRTSEINAPTEYITRGLRSDGSEFDMDVILSTFKLENIIHVLVILRDITELKKAEEALRESEARFRNMADTAPVLIWVSGPDSLCTYVNKPWLDFTGRKLEQEVGNGWVEDLYPADYKNSHLLYHKAFKAHNAYTMEYRLRRADGSYRWMLENGVPRFTSDGTFVGYIGSCTDITENKQAQEELNLLNAELEKRVKQRTLQLENSYKELEAFSYAVAHNLRSPLRGIDGWSLALLEDYDQILDEQGHYYLTLVRSEAQLMGNLIDDLLRLTHTTSIEIQKVDLDLTNLVKKVVAQVTKNYPKRKFEFEIESGLIIHADPSLLEIALASLIDNACKFTGLESIARIELGKVEVDGKSNFFIRDNGVGFNMEYTKKIFGAFQRMHKPADFPGAGIGLAIVHLIITRHGGNIWVESKPDEGATFYFTVSNEG